MKKVFLIIVTVVLLGSFSSCKKCTTCQIQRLNGVVEAEYEEYCGTPKEIDDLKDDLKDKSDSQLGSNGQVTCIDS